jgi:hypothetical protein
MLVIVDDKLLSDAAVLTPHNPMVVSISLAKDIERLAVLSAGAEAIGLGAADHAGSGTER